MKPALNLNNLLCKSYNYRERKAVGHEGNSGEEPTRGFHTKDFCSLHIHRFGICITPMVLLQIQTYEEQR